MQFPGYSPAPNRTGPLTIRPIGYYDSHVRNTSLPTVGLVFPAHAPDALGEVLRHAHP
jgi:hypothetical protein